LGESPLEAYERGLLETNRPALPVRIQDAQRLYLDFLPVKHRAISAQGIELGGIRYYSPELDVFIDDRRRRAVSFDPGCLDRVYVFDEARGTYITVPYNNLARPPISRSQLEAARRALAQSGRTKPSEAALFDAHERLQARVALSQRSTRGARRAREREQAVLESGWRAPRKPMPSNDESNFETPTLNFEAVAPFAVRDSRRSR
jgi:putative transposase